MNSGIAGGIAAAVVIGIVMNAARGRAKVDTATRSATLEYHAILKVFAGLAGILIPAVIVVAVAVAPPKKAGDWYAVAGLLGGFGIGGGLFLAECFRKRVVMSPEGLVSHTLWARPLTIRWEEITAVKYSVAMSWFIVEATGGRVVRIHLMLTGLKTFAEAVRHYLKPEIYEDAKTGLAMIEGQ
jgi:hypothetical protein